jgi:hypothetical protein
MENIIEIIDEFGSYGATNLIYLITMEINGEK